MSEHIPPERYRTLTDDEKRVIIARAHELVPYEEGAVVDQLGSFVKHFRLPDEPGFVSIYIPGLAGTRTPGEVVSDSIWIVKRIPEDLGNGIGLTHITNYMIDLVDLSAVHIVDVRVFDIDSKAEIRPATGRDERAQQAREEFESQSSEMTTNEFAELTALLDSLDPNDTFELPDA